MKRIILFQFTICLFLAACTPAQAREDVDPTVEALVEEIEAQRAVLEAQRTVLETQIAALERQGEMLSYLATNQPPRMPDTPMIITPTAWDMVSGGVEIEGGACCAGGTTGDTITLEINLYAHSNTSEITHMRMATGMGGPFTVDDLVDVEWIPYVEMVTTEMSLAINWVGYWVGVQFMDADGNISDVYSDDISLEGMPPQPTVMP